MNIDVLNLTFTILSIAIPVFATIYTAYSRIRNENRETHKPYLVLDEIVKLDDINKYKYYLNFTPNKDVNPKNKLFISLIIKNIGYGVASNIKFYNLSDGEEIEGLQEKDNNQIQKLFTTLDIAANNEKKLQACISNNNIDDNIKVLCVYKDLNENVYDLIINISIKENNNYHFFAYQPSSRSYRTWIKKNKKAYYKIYHNYSNQ